MYWVAPAPERTIFANPVPETFDRYTLYPASAGEVLATHVNRTTRVEAVTPVPVRRIVDLESLASLVMEIDPDALPVF